MKNCLLFINGTPPKNLPDLTPYSLIACTDGAFHYLEQQNFPLEKLDFISGDFDSGTPREEEAFRDKFIFTPNQDKTDFDKALEIILERGGTHVHVLGGSGGEMDHFLGNLTVAFSYRDRLNITFSDEYADYFFISKPFKKSGVLGKMISLYPFPMATNITTTGLNWPLKGENLDITSRIGTRNYACEDEVTVSFENGALLIFIGEKYL